MTVKILNEAQKYHIEALYGTGLTTQKELAQQFNVSERTINRVLVERGLLTPKERWTVEQQNILKLVKRYGLTASELQNVLTLYKANANAA